MKRGTIHHPKFKRLKRRLGVPSFAVAGVLECLWAFAAEFAEDGDLSRFAAQDIADHMEWDGDAEALVSALVAERWLDRAGRRLIVHDWQDHLPEYLRERARKRKTRNELRADDASGSDGHSADIPGMSRDCPVPVLSDPIRSDLGESDQGGAVPRASRDTATHPVARTIGLGNPLAEVKRQLSEVRAECTGGVLVDADWRKLMPLVQELHRQGKAHESIAAFRAFHADTYWQARGHPVRAFVESYSEHDARAKSAGRPRITSNGEGATEVAF